MARPEIDITESAGLQAALKGTGNEQVNALLQQLLFEKLTQEKSERDVVKEQLRHRRETAVVNAKLHEDQAQQQKDNCSHRKEDQRTRLGGQFLSDGRLFLTCQGCAEAFYYPAREGEKPIPQELMPRGEMIGGAVSQMLPQAVGR